MAVSRITTPAIADEAITQAKIAASVDLGGAVKIANVQVANSSWSLLDDTAVDTDGGYVLVNGTNFVSGCNVLVGNTAATSVTFVSATQLRVQVPATAAGSYVMYVSNPDGSTGIRLNAITFSADPQWVTDSTLPGQVVDTAISIQLSATDATVYALQAGSSLPANTTLASNGLFSGTITGVESETVYNFTVVATDAENQDSPRAFSVTVSVGDAYFKEAVLVLNSEANTFIRDASNNNFAITITGDTRPATFSPYNADWSYYFSGSDYLSIAANTAFLLPGDFTIEAWVYLFSVSGGPYTLIGTKGATNSDYFDFRVYSNNLQLSLNAGSGTNFGLGTLTPHRWAHIAAVRSGSSIKCYVDGVQTATTVTNANTLGLSAYTYYIGQTTISENLFAGWMSNLRVLKGTALYTSTFTPPTSPLTAISNTILLTCQSNRFVDNSTNAFTLSRAGTPRITGFSPFTETDTTTGSAYFDGTGDYLTAPNSSGFDFGSGDFTIEAWVFPYSLAAAQDLFGFHAASPSTNADVGYTIYVGINNASNEAAVYSSTTKYAVTGWSITTYQWQHIAFVRTSGVLKLFINGVQVGSNVSASVAVNNNAAWPFYIGTYVAASRNFNGAISNLRVVKGTAVYTSAFTPPAAPLEAIANTQLLTLQTRISHNTNQFVDSSGVPHVITRNGNIHQGSFSPYVPTGWSGYFDGTGDWLTIPGSSAFDFGTGNFTVEAWVNPMGSPEMALVDFWINGGGSYITGQWQLVYYTNDSLSWVWASGVSTATRITSASNTVPRNAWTHVALTRTGNTFRIFTNGVEGANTTLTQVIGTTSSGSIGRQTVNSASPYTGYISNVRILKGTSLYTSNFTPPTSPLKPISNTQLLMLRSRSFVDESANRFAITRSGDTKVIPFSPFKSHTITANSYSMYFDGTGAGDYFSVASSNALAFGTGDFTIEGWYYPLAYTSNTSSIMSTTSLDSSTNNAININVTANGSMILGGAHATANNLVPLNTWTHFVVSRVSSTIKIFLDGVERVSAANSSNFISTGCLIGARLAAGTYYPTAQAYISNIKVVTGFGVTSVTVPTTPLTANSSTVLLTCQSNTIIDNSNNAFSFTAAGTRGPLASKFNPFGETISGLTQYNSNSHGGSAYLDTTGDYIEYSSNTTINDMRVGVGNWTIEGWFYGTNSTSTSQYLYWHYGATTDIIALRYNGSTGSIIGSMRATNLTEQTLTSSINHPVNQWVHVAMARANTTTVRLFTNGILSNTLTIAATASVNDTTLSNYTMGCSTNPVANYFNGYLSNWRYIKGDCLYRTSFIPPDQPLQPIKGTHALQNYTAGSIIDQSGRATFEVLGNASTYSAIKKYGTGSIYFDGTDDRITAFASPNYAFGTGDFTIEAWVYTTTLAGERGFLQTSDTAGGLKALYTSGITISLVGISDPRYWYVNVMGTGVQSNTSPIINTWYHVAVTRASGNVRLFVNGTLVGGPTSITTSIAGQNLVIGGYYSTTYLWNGYVDDLRITRGVARYTSNFTAPSELVTR